MLNMDSERHFSRGKSTPSLAGGGVTSVRHESNERSWMDMLSFVSRPAWSLLQRYLPGNSLSAAQPHNQLWDTEGLEHTIGFGHKLTRLENTRSSLQPQFLHCEHVDSGLHPSVEVGAMTWMTADSLSEIGIQTIADSGTSQSTSGYLSVARNFLSQFMLNVVSTQEVKRSQNLLAHGAASDGASVLSWTRETTVVSGTSDSNHHSGSLCHLAERTTMASVAKPTGLFVHCDDGSSKHRESAGHCCHKAAPDNDCLHMLRPVSLPREQQQQELRDQANAVSLLGDISVGCARSEVVLLTPEQDNGYSSLEEELSNSRLPSMRKAGEEQLVLVGVSESGKETEQQQHSPTEEQPELESEAQVQQAEELCEENIEQQQEEDDQAGAEQAEVSATPEEQREAAESSQVSPCRNKAIAYIMGSPCSDDSSSGEDSDEDSNDEDDDDGFNSEGSSCLSDSDSSEEEEEEDEDDDYDEESDAEEFNAETERLWNSLCQNRDPYNPRNFTASISTARPISHNASAAAAAGSSPASLQVLSSSPLSASPLSTSPLSGSEFSSSGSGEEAEDAESLRLWDSFSCSSDPYNPFNFQAPLRTRLPPAGSSGSGKAACSVPRYQREQAEERQDSGFGDEMPAPPASAQPCRKLRKVRFCEEVEEFYTSGDEDRHGPWEEFARDRCRFQRRVLEVEESISFCLTPAFRLQVYHRLQLT